MRREFIYEDKNGKKIFSHKVIGGAQLMECLSLIEKSGECEIADKSKFCPKCGTETIETNRDSPLGKKRLCEKCNQTFIRELFVDCENKKIEIRLKNI